MVAKPIRQLNSAIDERVGTQSFLKSALDHIFPDNWSFMLGELAMYCFIIIIVTGIYLTLFFDPSDSIVTYHGTYVPLQGQSMPLAYESVVRIDLDVRGGLLFRQIHHWSADIFAAAIILHLGRIFFTGAFRKPRDINWTVGLTLFVCVIFEGFTGYSLPGDLLSGLGLRVAYSVALSIPVVGNWVAYLLFGGQFPSDQIEHRLYVAHILLLPLLIIGLLGIHLSLIWRQKHTEFPGNGRSERKLVGSQLWPTYAARSIGLFAFTAGVVTLLGGLLQINPIWLYGPYTPHQASSAAQPDWYVGFLEGSLRMFPAWRWHLFGYTVSTVFWPAVAWPATMFILMYAWPWLERMLTSDIYYHNLLDRPRDRPGRTAFGVWAFTFVIIITLDGGQDVITHYLDTNQPTFTLTMRGLAIVVPVVAAVFTYYVCKSLQTAAPPVGEHPKGPAGSETPPMERYLPDRARYEADGDGKESQPVLTRARQAADVGTAVGAGVATATGIGASWMARRRARHGGNGNGSHAR